MDRRIGERRGRPRFEIVGGDLWGTIDAQTTLTIRNLGQGGALVDSWVPLAAGSVHWVNAVIDGAMHPMQIRVRHCTGASTRTEPAFLIGLEFLQITGPTQRFIDRHVGLGNGAEAESV